MARWHPPPPAGPSRPLPSLCSPFEVKVGTECGNQKVRAWGPGLEGGVVGKSADFVVEAIGDDVGTLGELGAGGGGGATTRGRGAHGTRGCRQASRWRARRRPRSNVMTRAMAPAMCATGPRRPASTQCTCCATARTSASAPSWPTSARRPRTSTRTGYGAPAAPAWGPGHAGLAWYPRHCVPATRGPRGGRGTTLDVLRPGWPVLR